jgi:hypothetical protein
MVMSELVTALRQELNALEAELMADPRHRKVAKIRELLAMYEAPASLAGAPAAPPIEPEGESKIGRVRAETTAFIERSGGIAHRQDILVELLRLGIMGKERSPMASLAAYLSEMPEFSSVGAGRWKIIRENINPDVARKPRRMIRTHVPGSASGRVVEFTVRFLREKGRRAQAPEIIDAMRAEGFEATIDTVSSSLSHSPLFDNVRGQGYGLVDQTRPPETETPNRDQLFGAPRSNGAEPLRV